MSEFKQTPPNLIISTPLKNNNNKNNNNPTNIVGDTKNPSSLSFIDLTSKSQIDNSSQPAILQEPCDPQVLVKDHTTQLTRRPCQPIIVAYVVSLIKCGDFQSTPEGLADAALVLRHSIHRSSSRVGVSHYDYQMYVLVHSDAEPCSSVFGNAGFQVLIRHRPVELEQIQGFHLRSKIPHEWCCGHDEFIKLYSYTLPEPIVVHVDMDFVFQKPLDDIFDALLFDPDSTVGREARQRVIRERPTDPWPLQPQAMFTRDWGQVHPGRKAGFQAGFIVLRPNPQLMNDILDIVKEGNFEDGFSRANGWGGKGYGGFVGAMAMQGLMAYYYDIIAPNTSVELNQCRYNHMGMDVRFNPGGPGFQMKSPLSGKCRNGMENCEDCMNTDLDLIYNIHYTQCRKPWMCIGEGDSTLSPELHRKPQKKTRQQKNLIPEANVHLDHCMQLLQVWHNHRLDLEQQLEAWLDKQPSNSYHNNNNNNKSAITAGRQGTYKEQFFRGHCSGNGKYLTLASGHSNLLQQISQLYLPQP